MRYCGSAANSSKLLFHPALQTFHSNSSTTFGIISKIRTIAHILLPYLRWNQDHSFILDYNWVKFARVVGKNKVALILTQARNSAAALPSRFAFAWWRFASRIVSKNLYWNEPRPALLNLIPPSCPWNWCKHTINAISTQVSICFSYHKCPWVLPFILCSSLYIHLYFTIKWLHTHTFKEKHNK